MFLRLGRLRHRRRQPTVPIRGPEQHDDCVPALTTAAFFPDGTIGFAIAGTGERDDASGTRQVHRMVFVRSLAHPASPPSATAADHTTAIATTVIAAAAAAATAAAAAA